jgi:hypothetical protein
MDTITPGAFIHLRMVANVLQTSPVASLAGVGQLLTERLQRPITEEEGQTLRDGLRVLIDVA